MKANKLNFVWQLVVAFFLLSAFSSNNGSNDTPDLNNIIDSMTLEQKAQLVVGTGMYFPVPDSLREAVAQLFGGELDDDSDYSRMVNKIRQYLPGTAGVTAEFPELGITSQTLADGPAGLRISPTRPGTDQTFYATAFPIATVLASTWDTEIVEQVGDAMGEEVLEYGADILLAPALNLQRDPLCGRNFEYYSEDPLVSGKIAAAMVKGVQSNGVGTSIKHFAANNQETYRGSVNAIVSERALRELYLKGFEVVVKEAKPWTVMSSYNKVNGTYTSESHDLLTKILREDWGFDGYVMTDWGGGSDIIAQMEAGNDMIQPGSPQQIDRIITAVKEGELNEAVLDQNVERILRIMMETPRYKGYDTSNKPDLEAHAQITRQAASDGMVLLENKNNTLPISSSDVQRVAAFGTTSYDFISGGTGSGDVNEAYTVSLIQGLEGAGFEVDEDLKEIYNNYIETQRAMHEAPSNPIVAIMGGMEPVDEMQLNTDIAEEMAAKTDIAVITIGRNAGEGEDRQAVEGDFYLTPVEKQLIENVTDAYHAQGKKAIVILNIAGIIETASWSDIPDAVLCAWLPGQEGGNSVVDVISGKVNPSGKLAATIPVKYEDASTSEYFPGYAIEGEEDNTPDLSGVSFLERVPWEVIYKEDIYVGYRYYNTFDVPVAYEFGYGKSYTEFGYSNVSLSSTDFSGEVVVSVDVENIGDVAGREVVQVYATAPDGTLEKPEEELVAFGKTRLLQPGEKETLSFTVGAMELASYNEDNSSWIAEAGNYTIKIGASSRDIREEATLTVADNIVAGTVTKALEPQRDFEKMSKQAN